MKIIDLSHELNEDMPVYPGTEKPSFKEITTYDKEGYKETLISMYSHTGTHIDPPAHIFKDRSTLDMFPISQFIGKAVVIDCRDLKEGEEISLSRLNQYHEFLDEADFLLFNLGWDKFWDTERYFGNYPFIDDEVLNFILNGNYKGIGFDVIGLDPIEDTNLTRHKKLFYEKDIINVENLNNLDKCYGGLFTFCCMPLKIKNSDGSPTRAFAILE